MIWNTGKCDYLKIKAKAECKLERPESIWRNGLLVSLPARPAVSSPALEQMYRHYHNRFPKQILRNKNTTAKCSLQFYIHARTDFCIKTVMDLNFHIDDEWHLVKTETKSKTVCVSTSLCLLWITLLVNP